MSKIQYLSYLYLFMLLHVNEKGKDSTTTYVIIKAFVI